MGLLQRFKSAFKPKNSINYDSLGLSLGYSGDRVSAEFGMRSATVYACVKLLSESIASLPVKIYKNNHKGNREFTPDHPLYRVLAIDPNKLQSSYEWREQMVIHLMLRGSAFSRVFRNAQGDVVALVPLHPDSVSVNPTADGTDIYYEVTYSQGSGPDKRFERLDRNQMLHVKGAHSDILTPITPLSYLGRVINSDISMSTHQDSVFGPNSVRPGGVISTDEEIAPEIASRIMHVFNKKFAGPASAGKTMFLDSGMQFTPLTMSNSDAQFIESRRFGVQEICRAFGVPPSLIHENSNSTFSNSEQQSIAFVKHTLRPLVNRIEQSLIQSLLPRLQKVKYEIDFDFQDMLRGDNESTANYLTKLVQGGIATPNEVRGKLGLDRVEEEMADSLFIQQNMSSMQALKDNQEAQTKTSDLENEQNELMNNISKKLISEAVNE